LPFLKALNQYQGLWFEPQLFSLTKFVRFFSEIVRTGAEEAVKKMFSLGFKEMQESMSLKTELISGRH
jgi:hypothetical protein